MSGEIDEFPGKADGQLLAGWISEMDRRERVETKDIEQSRLFIGCPNCFSDWLLFGQFGDSPEPFYPHISTVSP